MEINGFQNKNIIEYTNIFELLKFTKIARIFYIEK